MFRIMNLKELHQLEEEIDQMDDAKEKEARSQLIEQIMEKITDYDVHVREYAYQQAIQSLVNRGITYAPTDRWIIRSAADEGCPCRRQPVGDRDGDGFSAHGVEPAPGACTREGAGQSAAGIWRRKKKKQGTWPDGKPEHNKCRKERKK